MIQYRIDQIECYNFFLDGYVCKQHNKDPYFFKDMNSEKAIYNIFGTTYVQNSVLFGQDYCICSLRY